MANGETPKPHPRPVNTKSQVLKSHNNTDYWCRSMRNQHYDDHFAKIKTYYLAGNDEKKSRWTLVGIDIDCKHKGSGYRGTLDGAMQFAEWLKDNLFENLYYEVSTNGNGVHGYIVLDKGDYGVDFINELLKRLQTFVRQKLEEQGFDVGDIEVKGALPVRTWGNKKGELLAYKSGGLMKLPREHRRFDELRATTVVSTWDIMRLPIGPQAEKKKSSRSHAGSISGRMIGEDEIQKLDSDYLDVAVALLAKMKLKVAGMNRSVVSPHFMAVFLMLGKFFTENMNADGSLPWDRWHRMWNCLKDVEVKFDAAKFAACRNYLDSLGLIDWEDNRYVIGIKDADGNVVVEGRAMKWKFDGVLMQMLNAEKWEAAEPASVVDVRGEASLSITTIEDIIETIEFIPSDQQTRPELVDHDYFNRLDYDLVERIITPIDRQMALAA
jgi:hypothetical protein